MYMASISFLLLLATGINVAELVASPSDGNFFRERAASWEKLESITRRSSAQEKCQSPPSVDTLVEIGGVPTLVATCDYMVGQLGQPDSKAGQYISHVKDRGGESCTYTSPCVEVCIVNVEDKSAGGVSDILNGLKTACGDAGGEYCEQQA